MEGNVLERAVFLVTKVAENLRMHACQFSLIEKTP